RIERIAAADPTIRVVHMGATELVATLSFGDGELSIELAPGTKPLANWCDLQPAAPATSQPPLGRRRSAFVIETSVFDVEWPADLDLWSTDPGAPSPFDLVGREEELVYVQGPFALERLPAIPELVAPGQRIVARGTPEERWIELSYEHAGKPY